MLGVFLKIHAQNTQTCNFSLRFSCVQPLKDHQRKVQASMLPNESIPSRLDVLLDPPGDVPPSLPHRRLTSSACKPSAYKQLPRSRQHKYGKQIISFILWFHGQASWYHLKRNTPNLPAQIAVSVHVYICACTSAGFGAAMTEVGAL